MLDLTARAGARWILGDVEAALAGGGGCDASVAALDLTGGAGAGGVLIFVEAVGAGRARGDAGVAALDFAGRALAGGVLDDVEAALAGGSGGHVQDRGADSRAAAVRDGAGVVGTGAGANPCCTRCTDIPDAVDVEMVCIG